MQKNINKVLWEKDRGEKENQIYESIISRLKPHKTQFFQNNSQSNILQDLQNFHRYYRERCEQYKQKCQVLSQQNWEYVSKMVKYQQTIENYQIICYEAQQKAKAAEQKVQILKKQIQNMPKQPLNEQNDPLNMRGYLTHRPPKLQGGKRKVVKLKQKSVNIEETQNLDLQSQRSNRKINNLKHQIQQYVTQRSQLLKQNQILLKKLQHLEADRKYQDERLKNATLSMQIDIKMKNEQISRLQQQIQIYEIKFNELIQSMKNNSVPVQIQAISTQASVLSTRMYDNIRNIPKQFSEQKSQQKTQRKIHIENTQKVQKKTHKRHGSSNLQQHKIDPLREDLCMKIKVYKYNKNKKHL